MSTYFKFYICKIKKKNIYILYLQKFAKYNIQKYILISSFCLFLYYKLYFVIKETFLIIVANTIALQLLRHYSAILLKAIYDAMTLQ